MRKPLVMPLSPDLKVLAALGNVDAQVTFLSLAIEAIEIIGHKLTDFEKYGFHLCIDSLRDNVEYVLKIGGKL